MAVKTRDRVFALVTAVAFLVSVLILSIAVIIEMVSGNKDASQNSAGSDTTKSVTEGNKLQGTQLTNFTPVAHVDGLQKIDTKVGTGDEAKPGDTVTVDYTGAVAATGVIFQSSLDTGQPVSFGLNQVIAGWTNGVPGMKVGGERRLLIPAAEAYGANPPAGSGIPANADLVFDITLHKVGA